MPAKAPFLWKVLDVEHEMEFIGGLLGISQEPDSLSLRPEIGWAIRDVPPKGRERPLWTPEEAKDDDF